MSGTYELPLDYVLWAILRVEFTTQGKEVTDYAEIKGGYREMIEGWRGQ